VLQVKEKIAIQDTKAAVEKQKLIHSGRILVDDKTVEESGIKEGDFLVLMISSSIAKPKAPAAAPSVGAKAESSSASATAAATTTATTTATTAPVASNTTSTQIPASPSSNAASATTALPFGVNEAAVSSICEMGFPRDEVIRALRASFGNADRAVEYLTNGIPEGVMAAEEQGESAGRTNATSEATASEMPTDEDTPLTFLRRLPQFVQLRLVVQQNPRLLGPLLEQIAQSNPEIFQLISENQEAFMAMIQAPLNESELQALTTELGAEGDEGEGSEYEGIEEGAEEDAGAGAGAGGALDSAAVIQVSEEEKAAIDRLMALGFDRHRVIEAFFACDKNESIAANFLFEHMNDEDF
jgi:UV excision repair protein RAD23